MDLVAEVGQPMGVVPQPAPEVAQGERLVQQQRQ
eukprot:CAMPEP_0172033950 /NCGR_PEP_ID=MMETSP1041-20130122/20734_1 /TAXON_ID=464988 /ORGANISM="Hemiselmis andersenii, Strain CCMP439" /LENGTH=33 /DNA_ID= /DNA_START= /DNA_END= /DNA_ORIENTATION=